MRAHNNFKKGAVEMLLLHILNSKGDCYGYQLSQLIRQTSDDYLIIPEGSLYPALYKLIEKGYISDYKKQIGKRLTRVYYHIETAGRNRLTELVEDYLATTESIKKILNHDFSEKEMDDTDNE
ncbi:MAG: helix-turn-helix transcriptional regulator [Dorea sp.]|nr:helix-turn-helix transcriptional regulator [Dorea sp.]